MSPHIVDVLLDSAVDLIMVHVGKDFSEVVAEGCYLAALEILVRTAATNLPCTSHLSSHGDSLGYTAKAVFFLQLGL